METMSHPCVWPFVRISALLGMICLPVLSLGQTGYEWNLPNWFPKPVVPSDNPMSAEKVKLGRYLFYDPRLSSDSKIACASCHQQRFAFSSGPRPVVGVSGRFPLRKAPSLANVAYYPALTWADPHINELEKQALIPMFNAHPSEMGSGQTQRKRRLVHLFETDPIYKGLFREAFPAKSFPYTLDSMQKALASFERTLISCDSPYDRYVYAHLADAISPDAKRGAELFFGEAIGCAHCHAGINLTQNFKSEAKPDSLPSYTNTGLYNVHGQNRYPSSDLGLYAVTGKLDEMGSFRIPTLRNVAITAPYMHDRSVKSLSAVIEHYRTGGRNIEGGHFAGNGALNIRKSSYMQGFAISASQRRQLESFLNSLTDDSLVLDERFANPWTSRN
jgi:cytochrome c peroxidase